MNTTTDWLGSRELGGIASTMATEATTWPPFLRGQPDHPVRVVMIDDDPHMCRVIAQELLADARIDLVAQANSLREGRHMVARYDFDVMLVDLNLGDGTGFELIEYMKSAHPVAEAVVVSAMEDEEHAIHAFELGATGYLVKGSWFGNFAQAVLHVVNGGATVTPNLARRLLRRLGAHGEGALGAGAASRHAPGAERLSEREREILRLVASGHTSCEIGRDLSISAQTVNTHIKNIYRKLQVRTRAQAATRASQFGLLS
ncbi:MAG: response regulator transcription factor [Proteobacteria bacterium]|nr:response regulator transcription factor [Pseudomonadota bacterium]